jgi:malate dehydrogenase (oxaloacetate-decarboxylating)(NADP+)
MEKSSKEVSAAAETAMDHQEKSKTEKNETGGNLDEQALFFHRYPRPGKLEIQAIKPLGNQRDLALAYSPGVAAPCLAIRDNPETAAD